MNGPLWLACPESAVPQNTAWLSAGEEQYARRQRFTKRRVEFLVARFTAKTAVTRVLGLSSVDALARVEIRHEPSGAPFACVDGARTEVEISLTDRAGWAACLVSSDQIRIGCDLELVERRSAVFVDDYFTSAERHYVLARPDGKSRELAANLIWSAKEAALKVLTTGLRQDTRTVEVSTEDTGNGWQPMTVTADTGAAFPGWWRRLGNFVLTVAAAGPIPPPHRLPSPWNLATATPTHTWVDQPTVSH
jgi:4'-phosphopantetheinyl transferase